MQMAELSFASAPIEKPGMVERLCGIKPFGGIDPCQLANQVLGILAEVVDVVEAAGNLCFTVFDLSQQLRGALTRQERVFAS